MCWIADEEESEEDDDEDIQTKSGKGKKRNVHRKMDEDLSDDEDHIDQVRKLCYSSCFLFPPLLNANIPGKI